jgi:hypothetical protein
VARRRRVATHDAAKESNLPSRGMPGPASFEDWMGHQARAAPDLMLRAAGWAVRGGGRGAIEDGNHPGRARAGELS